MQAQYIMSWNHDFLMNLGWSQVSLRSVKFNINKLAINLGQLIKMFAIFAKKFVFMFMSQVTNLKKMHFHVMSHFFKWMNF